METIPRIIEDDEQENKEIKPYEEVVELINLGTEDNKKEIKIGTIMKDSDRKKLIDLVFEYVDVFAWTY